MENTNSPAEANSISKKIIQLMVVSGLEIPGFAEFTGVSESHIYALKNGSRHLTLEMANKIGLKFKIPGQQLMDAKQPLPKTIRDGKPLIKFYKDHQTNTEYFTASKLKNSDSYQLNAQVNSSEFFLNRVYIWEIKDFLAKQNLFYTSKQLSQMLNYLVQKQLLVSEKKPFKRKDGTMSTREVLVYWKQTTTKQL